MKKIYIILFSFLLFSCGGNNAEKKIIDANAQLEKDLEMYQNVWNTFLIDGDTSTVNSDNFTEDCVVVTDQGDVVGIEAVKNHYLNYLNGFSDIEFKIIDAFGQGDRLVKHWNFKGKHTGDFFGIPATGNYLDLSGTTMITMKDGKIAKEHDFFDMKSMLDQLLNSDGDVVIDEYQAVN